MNFKFKYTDKIVGMFILASIFLLAASFIFIVFNQKLFERKVYFKTQFKDAEGLKPNKDITFKGFKIGRIKTFSLNNDNMVDTVFFVYAKYHDKVKLNSVISKSTNPIAGSSIFLMPSLTTKEVAKANSFIPSLDSREGELLYSLGEIEKKTDSISNIINNLDSFVASLNRDNNAGDNSVARILVNAADIVQSIRGQMDTINATMKNLRELSNNMKNPDGLVQRMLDPSGELMFNSIKSSLDNLDIMMKELSVFSKFLNNQSKNIESILVDGKNTIHDAQEVVESIKNNPIIKGGISSDKKGKAGVKESIRDRDF
jgi:phospholipid/cholesterol/gamma-HCH transport system substrate-binding protein